MIKGKDEYGGGWLCWRKRDGCGAKFADGDQAIESQSVGEIDNPDLPDLWNTVVKMAEKRARVDAVLAVTGASALFTQDVEDVPPPAAPAEPPASGGLVEEAKQACRDLAGPNARALWGKVAPDGTLPHAVGTALVYAAAAHKAATAEAAGSPV